MKRKSALDHILDEYIRFGCDVMTRREYREQEQGYIKQLREEGVSENTINMLWLLPPKMTQEEKREWGIED